MKRVFEYRKALLFTLIIFAVAIILPADLFSFGFFAHRKINRMAVFTLPPEMLPFYRKHIEYLTERSIDPDRRAHVVPGEAQRHYIDIDHYDDDPFGIVPRKWEDAIEKYTEDTLQKYGVIPWHIEVMMRRLTYAFRNSDVDGILYNSAHLGHYIADACTPLHTTLHYNGRTPEQKGIHALWESRLPELFADNYNYFVGKAEYVSSPLDRAWEIIKISHNKVNTIYDIYDYLYNAMSRDMIFAHEMRGQSFVRTYSRKFSKKFHDEMNGMVERQLQLAVKSVGDFWYTAWVNAGQPELLELLDEKISEEHRKKLEKQKKKWKSVEMSLDREKTE